MMMPDLKHIKFICPSALEQSVTLNFGMVMPAWYDLYALSANAKEDIPGVTKTAQFVEAIIEQEMKASGLSADRIVLGGFSQGGSMALFVGLTTPKKLAGILGLSTFAVGKTVLLEKFNNDNLTVPLLMCHGNADPLVRHEWGQLSFNTIKQVREEKLKLTGNSSANANCEFKSYSGLQHSSNRQEMIDVCKWIISVLPKQ